MNKRYLNWLIVFGVGAFSSLSVAEEVYHCVGKYNTGAEYNHLYTVDRSILGGTVDWEGQKFKIKNDLSIIYLYAVAVKFNGVDVLFIDNKSLDAEFSSIRFRSILVAKGKCVVSGLAWQNPANWRKIRVGMSSSQVESIVGKPSKVKTDVIGWVTLFYQGEVQGAGYVSGNVRLSNKNRVAQINPPVM